MLGKYYHISEITFQPKPNHGLFKDLTNQKFERLTVLGYAGKRGIHSLWFCKCECKNITKVPSDRLASKRTKSCGCLVKERIGRARYYRSSEYRAYTDARHRCNNPNNKRYASYGGRGIEFRFESFDEFFAAVGARPTPHHSLDRISNNGHYEPSNVKWSTKSEQQNNTRRNRRIIIDGQTKTITQWAEVYQVRPELIFNRIRRGCCDNCAVTLPVGERCIHR